MGLRPTQGDEKRIGWATALYGSIAVPLSSPSEAVLRTLRRSVFRESLHSFASVAWLYGRAGKTTIEFKHASHPLLTLKT